MSDTVLKSGRIISDGQKFDRFAKKHGDQMTVPWASQNSIFLEWVPLFHQMTIQELIDFMKFEKEALFDKSLVPEMFNDRYYLCQTPLRLIYDAQELWFHISTSGNCRFKASETTAVKSDDPEALETLDRSD